MGAAPALAAVRTPVIALVGNPNSGKTTLFNALTGLTARVGNYPGITVDHREGRVQLGGADALVLDLPGTYSLVPRAEDEVVALDGLLGRLPGQTAPDVVLCVVDATNLERNLYLAAQLRELPLRLVVALSMMDTVEADGVTIDLAQLASRIGAPVVPLSAVRAGGTDALKEELAKQLAGAALPQVLPAPSPDEVLASIGALVLDLAPRGAEPATVGAWAIGLHESGDARERLPVEVRNRIAALPNRAELVRQVVQGRWTRVRGWIDGVLRRDEGPTRSERLTARIDAFALHPVAGPLLLVLLLGGLFQLLFSGSAPLMDGIEAVVGALGSALGGLVPESMPLLRSLIVDGLVAGVGNVVVFVPQIAVLFLALGILEDSGYLARAAFLLDRLMRRVGLHGKAFVPMLSGFACAVPAIMAARTIESRKDRLVTVLVAPLMSCSARLPVYGLLIATVFATQPLVFGVVHPGAIVMLSMYALSVVAALGMAALFKRTLLKSPPPPFVLELPPYRLPRAGSLLRHVGSRVRTFLVDAGTVILALTIVLWGLFTFPRDEAAVAHTIAAKETIVATMPEGEARDAKLAELDATLAREKLESSAAGRLGKAIEPVIHPLGFDWKIGVGLVASFAAREVLVSTLGLVYGLGDGADEESTSLREAMRNDRDPVTGKPIHTPLTGLALMVFFVLAMQCMSTLAAVRRETGGWSWPAFQFTYMGLLAWVGAFVVFQGGRLLGFE